MVKILVDLCRVFFGRPEPSGLICDFCGFICVNQDSSHYLTKKGEKKGEKNKVKQKW